MTYNVTIVILCEEKVIEKLRSRLESWKHVELSFVFREERDDDGIWGPIPAHWCIYAVFDKSEKTNVCSLPLTLEEFGGIVKEISILRTHGLLKKN